MFFTIKLFLHLSCLLILNWIVWNRIFFIKMDLALNNQQRLICHKIQPTNQPTIYFKLLIIGNHSICSNYSLLCNKLVSVGHRLWGKQNYDAIHFSRNLETDSSTVWNSCRKFQFEDFTAFGVKLRRMQTIKQNIDWVQWWLRSLKASIWSHW